jgi:hypothetical protein
MALLKDDFERAVEGLLSPQHEDFMLFMQSQLEKDPNDLIFHKFKRAQEVIRMVRTTSPSLPPFTIEEALDVLQEAVRRMTGN